MSTLSVHRRPGFRSYWAVARIALRQRSGERLLWLSRVAFLGLVMLIFSRLWKALLPADAPALSSADCIWYIAITEWITLAQPRLFLEIERDVRSGELAYQLGRPTSYLFSKLAEALAEQALGLVLLGVAGAGFAFWLAAGLPHAPSQLLWALPLGLVASLLNTLCSALIGLSAFWLVDCSPLAWVFQKLTFVLGGLMVPLALYPDWLRNVALATPFAALIHGPGQMALGVGHERALSALLSLCLWTALSGALLAWVYARGLRAVELHGG
jgi:ABC-2 type transport system permease protein